MNEKSIGTLLKQSALLALLAISFSSFSQIKAGAGISLDFSGGYDFPESRTYRASEEGNSSTWEQNWNIGAFAKLFIGEKISIVAAGNANMFGSMEDGMEYIHAYQKISVTEGPYTTGVLFDEYQTDYLYGMSNPYYDKQYVSKYYANSFTKSNNLVAYVGYQPTEWLTIGTGVGFGFRKEVITIMKLTAAREMFFLDKTYTYYNSTMVPVERIESNTIQYYIPIVIDFHINNATGIYISSNISKDFFSTVGFRFDIPSFIRFIA